MTEHDHNDNDTPTPPSGEDGHKHDENCSCGCGGQNNADQSAPASNSPITHKHDHENAPSCSCCSGGDDSEESLAVIEEDPALRSLNKALGASFLALKLLMIGMIALFFITRVTFVQQGSIGLKRQFGKYLREKSGAIKIYEPGSLVFVWPEPIETLEKLPQSRVMTLKLKTEFWPELPADAAIKSKDLPEKPTLAPGKDGYALTGDLNILHCQWTVNYRIADVERYLLQSQQPEEVLRVSVQAAILKCIAAVSVDDAFYRRTGELFDMINRTAREMMQDNDSLALCGIEVINITSDDIRPPGQAQRAFSAITGALSEKTKLIDEARKFADIMEVEAKGEADRIRKEAEGTSRLIISRAKGDSQRLQDLLAKFPNDPKGLEVYMMQYKYDQLKAILLKAKRYILPPGKNWLMVSPAPQDYLDADEQNSTN